MKEIPDRELDCDPEAVSIADIPGHAKRLDSAGVHLHTILLSCPKCKLQRIHPFDSGPSHTDKILLVFSLSERNIKRLTGCVNFVGE